MTKQVPLASLIEAEDIYPRHSVDGAHVSRLVEAIKAGDVLPPIVAEGSSMRLVDGWHRVRAFRRVLGPEGSVRADLRAYATDADLILDAIRLNSGHGRRLDAIDEARSVILAANAGATTVAIASVLHMTEERVKRIRVPVAIAPSVMPGTVSGTPQVVLKRATRHLAGQTLTAEQVSAHASMPGTPLLLVIHQLRDALIYGLANLEDPKLREGLSELGSVIGEYLKP